jgi:hypothetical protein
MSPRVLYMIARAARPTREVDRLVKLAGSGAIPGFNQRAASAGMAASPGAEQSEPARRGELNLHHSLAVGELHRPDLRTRKVVTQLVHEI